jgi:2-oxoglutarate ferredoxin oxidoreductase subunit alpha
LHELSRHKRFGVRTVQAEDEIASVGAAIGAAYAGCLAMTGSSGPGIALKQEAIGLAVTTELPLVILNVQRGGPSTGLPTKTEQADLLQAIYGRNGESPVPVISASTPSDCFIVMMEAFRIALKYMTPVFVLTDGYLANGSEPWRIPGDAEMPDVKATFRTDPNGFHPFVRNDDTLARAWAIPGTPGLEHRIGGIEKDYNTGHISYDPANHEKMTATRANKVANIANDIPDLEVHGAKGKGRLLVLGWGSTFGSIRQAVEALRAEGKDVSHAHLRYMNPFPKNTEAVLERFDKILIPEMNLGQLETIIKAKFLLPAEGLHKVQGKPFRVDELVAKMRSMLEV